MKQLIYVLLLLFSGLTFAQNNADFEKANTLYNEGNYTEALETYKSVLEIGVHSAELYFNMANTHYKLNHIAPSIYYYEKALLLKPNDKDILNNIAYARNMTIDSVDEVPDVGFSRLINNATHTLSFDNWAKLSVGLMILFVLLFLGYYFSYKTSKKRLAFVTSLSSLGLALVAILFAFHKYELVEKDQPAIVFAQEAQIKTEPNLRSNEAFKLHEGTKVQVLDTVNNWKEIKLADGKTGWVVSDDIKMIKTF
ncbi:tetratricopeptide repeat protein [Psychroserpens algicola]|uniref:Tetratricopeptide repeat protein n=1 Tax=Psychroserpens algicola TaxID=1719034 RepID=A0ABT0H8T1_9FLAO|nr:tetratricopeptide repeat protein [Psychroserpens algicola]MCK8480250.1 tetratricopeptide repeat protein [Psychroserpens algicola]